MTVGDGVVDTYSVGEIAGQAEDCPALGGLFPPPIYMPTPDSTLTDTTVTFKANVVGQGEGNQGGESSVDVFHWLWVGTNPPNDEVGTPGESPPEEGWDLFNGQMIDHSQEEIGRAHV